MPSQTGKTLPRSVPSTIRKDLEARATSYGHEGQAYLSLMRDLIVSLEPIDIVEQILVKQAGDHAWMVSRLRRIENALLEPTHTGHKNAFAVEGPSDGFLAAIHREKLIAQIGYKDNAEYMKLREKLEPQVKIEEARLRAEREERKRQEHIEERRQLASKTATSESLAAAYVKNDAHLEKIGRSIALSEARFQASLRELERYRAARRPARRGPEQPIVDAHFTEVAPAGNDHELPKKARRK